MVALFQSHFLAQCSCNLPSTRCRITGAIAVEYNRCNWHSLRMRLDATGILLTFTWSLKTVFVGSPVMVAIPGLQLLRSAHRLHSALISSSTVSTTSKKRSNKSVVGNVSFPRLRCIFRIFFKGKFWSFYRIYSSQMWPPKRDDSIRCHPNQRYFLSKNIKLT